MNWRSWRSGELVNEECHHVQFRNYNGAVMKVMLLAVMLALVVIVPAGARPTFSAAGADQAAAGVRGSGHLFQGRRTDLPARVPGLPSPGRDCADVSPHLRGGAAVGARHQAESHGARDAALVHRPPRRRAQVQGRSLADRRRDRHDRRVGGRRRRPREPGRHAAAAAVRRSGAVEHRRTGSDHHAAEGAHGARCGARLVGRLLRRFRSEGGPLYPGGRDQAGEGRARRGPPRDHLHPRRRSGWRRAIGLPERICAWARTPMSSRRMRDGS